MNLQAFWHVAVMGGWREIVAEQSALLRSVGLRPMIGVAGWPGIDLSAVGDVVAHGAIHDFEFVTLRPLWLWCKDHPGDAVLYMHTKGASKPGAIRQRWRRLMERWVVQRWRENLLALADFDAVGVNDRNAVNYALVRYFEGNFWMATTDWVAGLDDPCEFRLSVPAARNRNAAEWWLLGKPGCRVLSLCCSGWSLNHGGVLSRAEQRQPPTKSST